LREFIVACGDGTELLEFIEKAFDKIALAVEREIASAWCEAVRLGWNDGSNSPLAQCIDERIGILEGSVRSRGENGPIVRS
jgi:hypothetical protein